MGALLLGAVFAKVISTASNYLFSPATNLINDVFVRYIAPGASNKRVLIVSRLAVVLLGCWALYQAIYAPSILEKMLWAYTIYSAALTPVVLAAFYSKRVTAWGAVAAIARGHGGHAGLGCARREGVFPPILAQRDAIFPALFAAVAAMVVVSLFTPKPAARASWRSSTPTATAHHLDPRRWDRCGSQSPTLMFGSPMPTRPCWVEIRTRAFEDNFRFLAGLAAPRRGVAGHREGRRLRPLACAVRSGGSAGRSPLAGRDQRGGRRGRAGALPRGAAAGDWRSLSRPGRGAWCRSPAYRRCLGAVATGRDRSAARAAGAARPARCPSTWKSIRECPAKAWTRPGCFAMLARFHAGSPLKLEGVMTHLFAADEADGAVTAAQLAQLDKVLEQLSAAGLWAEWLNVGNSAALLAGQAETIGALAARHGMKALLRPGLALYGLAPTYEPPFEPRRPGCPGAALTRLQPVLSWKTSVIGLRAIPAGAWWATTAPLWPLNPCGWPCWPRATAMASTGAGQPLQPAGPRRPRAACGTHQHGSVGYRRDRDFRRSPRR